MRTPPRGTGRDRGRHAQEEVRRHGYRGTQDGAARRAEGPSRVELLPIKGCLAANQFGAPNWIRTEGAATGICATWERAKPLTDRLDFHVGQSTEAPTDRAF